MNLTTDNIKKIINQNKILKEINREIKKLPLLTFDLLKSFDYVIDALNIEGGLINKFNNIKKILTEPRNKLSKKKILIIVRAIFGKQKRSDANACKQIAKQFKNVKLLYIHTNFDLSDKTGKKHNIKLIESCRTSKYCKPREVRTGRKTKGERLCVTPIIVLSGEYNIRPIHDVCEIDDLLVAYFAIKNNSFIISNTEDYSNTINRSKIESIKY